MSIQLSANQATAHPNYLVDMKYITTLTSMTDKWFYVLISEGKFPKPIKLGRSSRWRLKDVDAWLSAQANF